MTTWPAKDPDAVADYLYPITLDEGDSVASHTFVKLSGDVAINSQSRDGANVTTWLSGGTDGETAVFRVAWVTVGGRSFDDIITMPVIANEPGASGPYAAPRPADLIARFPAFAKVSTATIQTWLTDAETIVTTGWGEVDYRPAVMELAAHNMVKAGVPGIVADKFSGIAARGVTNFKSASFSASFDASAAARLSGTGFGSTQYGADFAVRLRRNVGGPRLVGCA